MNPRWEHASCFPIWVQRYEVTCPPEACWALLLHIPLLEPQMSFAASTDGACNWDITSYWGETVDNKVSPSKMRCGGCRRQGDSNHSCDWHLSLSLAVIIVALTVDTDGISLTIWPTELKPLHAANHPCRAQRLCCKDPQEMSRYRLMKLHY